MKQYLLDTNICVHWLRGKFGIDSIINQVGIENCCISEITVAELKIGALLGLRLSHTRQEGLNDFLKSIRIVPISNAIDVYASEKVRLRLAGTPNHDDFDLLIGCTAVAEEMVMVTENIKDFKNIKGIELQNCVEREQ